MSDVNDKSRRELLKATAAISAAGSLGLSMQSASASDTATAEPETTDPIEGLGAGRSRGDGKVKVTGEARYAVEHQPENPLYGVVIQSTVASGRISRMSTEKAQQASGVVAVYTHLKHPEDQQTHCDCRRRRGAVNLYPDSGRCDYSQRSEHRSGGGRDV